MSEAEHYAERLRRRIDGYVFVWEERSFMITASIGGVMIDEAGPDLRSLFAHADTACYMAKEMGRNRVHFYSAQDDEATRRRSEMEWANRLRWAADEQRLVLTYQEIWPLRADPDDAQARIELLLRFRDERGRLVPPGAFHSRGRALRPDADDRSLGDRDRAGPFRSVCIRPAAVCSSAAINLSGASIEDDALADLIIALLQRYRIDPSRVCFEITETVAVRQPVAGGTVHESPARGRLPGGAGRFRCRHVLVRLSEEPAGGHHQDRRQFRARHPHRSGQPHHGALRSPTSAISSVWRWWPNGSTDEAIVEALLELGVDLAQGFTLHVPELVAVPPRV